jgi:hypothetical protein
MNATFLMSPVNDAIELLHASSAGHRIVLTHVIASHGPRWPRLHQRNGTQVFVERVD